MYATGRSSRLGRSDLDRPETIEETADLVDAVGGRGVPVRVDHSDPVAVARLVARIEDEVGRLDILVNDVWGGDGLTDWERPLWEQSLDDGLLMVRRGVETHLVTSHAALRLLSRRRGGLVVEVTDGAHDGGGAYRGSFFYDLVKASVIRLAVAQAAELARFGSTAVSVSPGWLRSERMLDRYGVTEATWREATAREPHFCCSESPYFLGRGVAALAADPAAGRFAGRSLSSFDLAGIYGLSDRDGTRPDWPRYYREVVEVGGEAGDSGYRDHGQRRT